MIRYRHCQVGEECVGSGLREAPIDVDRLLGQWESLIVASEVGQTYAEIGEGAG